jgi:hypothetical protein
MKTRSVFLLLIMVLTGLTSCVKEDQSDKLEKLNSYILIIFSHSGDTLNPGATTAVFSLSCTGAIVAFNIPDDGDGINPVTKKGVCLATTPNPTTADILGYTEGYAMDINGKIYNSSSRIDGLQPATHYHARAYFNTIKGTFYQEDISFTTNPRPAIQTIEATAITATTAKVGGNITSTGGSFVVERGICYGTDPDQLLYGDNQCIEQEVQSCDGAGEFTIDLTNLIPGTLYYARSFVGVVTGIEYGDQLFEFGNIVTFTTR